MKRYPIPQFAADYPEVASTDGHMHLPFYCMNCRRKRETTYVTPDFGPLCDDCLDEMKRGVIEWFHSILDVVRQRELADEMIMNVARHLKPTDEMKR